MSSPLANLLGPKSVPQPLEVDTLPKEDHFPGLFSAAYERSSI